MAASAVVAGSSSSRTPPRTQPPGAAGRPGTRPGYAGGTPGSPREREVFLECDAGPSAASRRKQARRSPSVSSSARVPRAPPAESRPVGLGRGRQGTRLRLAEGGRGLGLTRPGPGVRWLPAPKLETPATRGLVPRARVRSRCTGERRPVEVQIRPERCSVQAGHQLAVAHLERAPRRRRRCPRGAFAVRSMLDSLPSRDRTGRGGLGLPVFRPNALDEAGQLDVGSPREVRARRAPPDSFSSCGATAAARARRPDDVALGRRVRHRGSRGSCCRG